MNALLSWQLIYHLSGLTLLGITEQEPLGTLPVAIRTAVLKTVEQIQPDAIKLILNQKSPLSYADAQYNYEYLSSWNYKNYSYNYSIVKLLEELPERFPTYQKVALRLLQQAVEKQSRLIVVDYQPSVAAFALALIDAIALVEQVSELYNLRINLPEIDIYFVGQTDEFGVIRLLHHYRGVEFEAPTNFVDFAKIPVRLHKSTNLPDKVDFICAAESLTSILPRNACIFRDLEDFAAGFAAAIGSTPPINQNPVSYERATLDYFARRYFSVPELKPQQVKLIQKALSKESSLGLLPTGFGKSLIFQLYCLLIPRAILVISPLRALIRDQVDNLQRLGLTCAESIVFGDTSPQRKKKLKDFKSGRYRLLYISPERLQTQEFYSELKETMQPTAPVGALIIDEAHCVSEWGHDFRPAYLQVGRLQQVLEEVSGRVIPIIALSATASPQVLKDIIQVLNLKTENIEQKSSDRPELSLSVHVVEEPEQKPKELARLVQKIIPQVLNIPTKDIISNQLLTFTNAGVIFAVYANAYGRSTIGEGVQYITYKLKQNLNSNDNIIQVHAGSAPNSCPQCESTVIQDEKNEIRRCLECNFTFSKKERKKVFDWDKLIQTRQKSFQNNEFPLMVATKSYGMGIDKRNIRFIIHHSLSSSLEAYYQEAGRAGRDGQHAHVALMYHPPHPTCQAEYLDKGVAVQPPCVSNKKHYSFWECPYFDKHLCDYGHQARFIRGNYEGLEKDVSIIKDVYQKLVAEEIIVETKDDKNRQIQLALYRLQQLSIVKDFSLKYRSTKKIEYQVDYNKDWTLKGVEECLYNFLIKKDVDKEYAKAQIIEAFLPFIGKNIQAVSEEVLRASLEILLGRIYETIPRMRYQMLFNQLEYANSHKENICRRIVIRSIFDSVDNLVNKNYRCGFCDVCNPSLKFEADTANILLEEAEIDDISRQINKILEEFDRRNIIEVLNKTIERGAVAGLFARVTNILERSPTNLSALYLAGALARQRKGRETIAFDYLRFGFHEGIKQGYQNDNLLIFYQEAALIYPEQAFDWLIQRGGRWDNFEGFIFLFQEAKNKFGINSIQYHALMLLWQIRKLNQISDEIALLKPIISDIRQGFASKF